MTAGAFHLQMMSSEVVSGISSCFQLLFQSQGQVAHVLLTRSPLVYPRRGLTVRLACVKHAASVRPEPGSNSPLKSIESDAAASAELLSQLVRSLTKDPMLDLSVNQSKESELGSSPQAVSHARARGFLVHYLALTFSTLLSSQVSGAHRAGAFSPAWGNSTYVMRSSQVRVKLGLVCSTPRGVRSLRIR